MRVLETEPGRWACATVLAAVMLGAWTMASRAGESAHWSYSGASGPTHWSELSGEFALCKSGQSQSPIDIVDAVDTELPPLSVDYQWQVSQIVHNGHAIQLSALAGSRIKVRDMQLELLQFHFHTPSENRIDGRAFPLELHFVHQNAEGELAVLAVLFEDADADNASLAQILETAPRRKGERPAAELKLREDDLLPRDRSYYLYSGSLTTPPCSEGVRWFVLQSPRGVSAKQVKAFAKLAGTNAREPQPIHSRLVLR
jgi:carbonic anhydrase